MGTHCESTADYERLDWIAEMRDGLAESERRIREGSLDRGWEWVTHRGALIRQALQRFSDHIVEEFHPDSPFVIYAVGGTGRQEICPGSDIDLMVLLPWVPQESEQTPFELYLRRQLSLIAPLIPGLERGLKCNSIEQIESEFDLESLASLLDADLLLGESEFDRRVRRTCRQQAAKRGLDFIFHITGELRGLDKKFPQVIGDIAGFHVKEGIGGLRNFQMTMWLYAFERWVSSLQVYEQVRNSRRFDNEGAPTQEVLDATGVLFATRCWIEQMRLDQSGIASTRYRFSQFINAEEMAVFRERFGADGLTRLNASRQTISAYRHETLHRLLGHGVLVPDSDDLVIWDTDGLSLSPDAQFTDPSKAFYALSRSHIRYHLPIAPTVKRAARKNISGSLQRQTGFIGVLIQRGSIAELARDWFEFGVWDKLLPGFKALSNKLYSSEHRTASLTQAARAIQRVQNLEALAETEPDNCHPLEAYFSTCYRDLGESARCALRMALLVEEIPPRHFGDPVAYGHGVREYVSEQLSELPGLSSATLGTTEFLLLQKRFLLECSELINQQEVAQKWFSMICESESRDAMDTVRALALFCYAAFDFHELETSPSPRLDRIQWSKIVNLTRNVFYMASNLHAKLAEESAESDPALMDEVKKFNEGKPLLVAEDAFVKDYFSSVGQRIGMLLPDELLSGPHVDNTLIQRVDGVRVLDPQRAHGIIRPFEKVVEHQRPIVEIHVERDIEKMTVFAWDFPGLFWRIAGLLQNWDCSILSTDLYSVADPNGTAVDNKSRVTGERRLIMDVLTFETPKSADASWRNELSEQVRQRIEHPESSIPDDTAEILAPVRDVLSPELNPIDETRIKFSCGVPLSNPGCRYALSRLLAERAGADLESISQDGSQDWRVPRTNFYAHVQSSIEEIAESLRNDLGEVRIRTESFLLNP